MADRPLMRRNVFWILFGSIGPGICGLILYPLMQLRLNDIGFNEGGIGLISSVNLWVVSFLVMYFSWKSDHTISRWGRRVPFQLIAIPFIVLTVFIFPVAEVKWLIVALMIIYYFFTDMQNSTYPLLAIDCVPRNILGRICAMIGVVGCLINFFAMRYGMRLAESHETLAFFLGGTVILVTGLFAAFNIKEPPIKNPATESFKPWSVLKIGWRDRRAIILMVGVAMVNSYMMMQAFWIWLYARNELGLTKSDIGEAASWGILVAAVVTWPVGWLVDHWGSYKVIFVFWALNSFLCVWLNFFTHDAQSLAVLMVAFAVTQPFFNGANIIVYRSADPAEVGSVTSSNAFVANLYTGCVVVFSGWMIQRFGGGYHAVWWFGIILATIGLGLLFVYRHLMKSSEHVISIADSTDCVPIK